MSIWSKADWDILKEKWWSFYPDFLASHGTRVTTESTLGICQLYPTWWPGQWKQEVLLELHQGAETGQYRSINPTYGPSTVLCLTVQGTASQWSVQISVQQWHSRDRENQTTWSQLSPPPPPPPPPTHTHTGDLILKKEDGVLKLLQCLMNPSKATGSDEIPTRLLKSLATELTPVNTEIFRLSVPPGMLPESWNYRPVSLTCILCKTLEHIFCMHKSEAISTGSGSSLQPTMAFEPNTRVRCNCWWPLITFYDIGTLGSKWISPFSTSVRLWYCPPPKAAR